MTSTEPGAEGRFPPGSPVLFSEFSVGRTLEELELVYRRRRELSERTGAPEGDAGRLKAAYEVARSSLEAVLRQAQAPGSVLIPCCGPAAAGPAAEGATGLSEATGSSDAALPAQRRERSRNVADESLASDAAGGSV